ncbi:sulfotransferase family protein [Neoasaia chiangmaiensis]|uniref:sulfotransferase family protein n=1 Tax=Neoasaia chiangmaiensis TaxID=320497 RepID=UPI00098B444F
MKQIHFISGLPRSGSTLLSAILRQNPSFYAGMSSPLHSIFNSLLHVMGPKNEFHHQITDDLRVRVLRSSVNAYCDHDNKYAVVFDTNRMWTTKISAIADIFPKARIICCVRGLGWIVDSLERLVTTHAVAPTRLSRGGPGMSVFDRCESWISARGIVGRPFNALRGALSSQERDRIIIVSYEQLVSNPEHTISMIYQKLGLELFPHDFNNVIYSAEAFDAEIGMPELHRVSGPVEERRRNTILPRDLFDRLQSNVICS